MALASGSRLSHYEILTPLGAGAMGEVYRAKDSRLGREVAIKVLPEHFADDAERLKRFEREAKTLASLNHPNVAQIFGVDQVGDTCFLVLELVPGESLEERLKRGPLLLDEALDVCKQIAEGLEAAHEAGVIHRDLKPANVRITPDGKVKVLDFGLAKPAREAREGSSTDSVLSTEAGRLLGTPTYMAPEQARGKSIDRRVDIWAFGCVLYECLTGMRAFAGETLTDVFAAVIERQPDWTRLPASTPPRVHDLLRRCLEKDLANRQRGAGDAALDLRAARAQPGEPVARDGTSRGRSLIAAWTFAVMGIAAGIWGWLGGASPRSTASVGERVVRFTHRLPSGVRLCPSDRLMNEIAIAPDGSRIVYVVEEDKRTAVFSLALGESEPKRLDAGQDMRGPTFSPNGTWLAFFKMPDTLMRVPLAGGPAQRIAAAPQPNGSAAWLADDRIAYAAFDPPRIVEVDVAHGTTRVVAKLSGKLEGFENVAASPDPSWLLVDGWKGLGVTDSRISAVDRKSGAIEVLVANAASPAVVGRDILVFQRGAALFALKFDFSAKRALGEPQPVVSGVSTDRWGGSSQFAAARDGTLVMAPGRRRGEGRHVVWAGRDGTVEPIRAAGDAFTQLELATKGQSLIVSTVRDREELWAINLVGRGMSPIVAGEIEGVALAPSGDEVVYCINTEQGSELRRARIGGGSDERLLEGKYRPSSISSDGRYVLASGDADLDQAAASGIFALDTTFAPPRIEPWLVTAAKEGNARFSPDEKWVAYQSDRSGRYEVFVRAWPDGQRDWKISGGEGEGTNPRWSPDGRTIYYLDDVRLMAADITPSTNSGEPSLSVGAAREVLSSLAFAEVQDFGVGPDGRIAMIQLADWELAESRLEIVVGWAQELEQLLATRH